MGFSTMNQSTRSNNGNGCNSSFLSTSGATHPHPSISRSRDTIATMLSKKLGPEYLSTRPAAGGSRVTYIEGWRAISLANEVFGYDGWSSEIKHLEVDFLEVNQETGRVSAGVTAIIRVTLKDSPSLHEDIGYGSVEGARNKCDALDKCKKEAVTDGLKRALRSYGSLLGNCVYDKQHIQEASKIKGAKPKFAFSDLYRKDDYLEKEFQDANQTMGPENCSIIKKQEESTFDPIPEQDGQSPPNSKVPEQKPANQTPQSKPHPRPHPGHPQPPKPQGQHKSPFKNVSKEEVKTPITKAQTAVNHTVKNIEKQNKITTSTPISHQPKVKQQEQQEETGGGQDESVIEKGPGTMELDSLCDDVDFDEFAVEDSGFALSQASPVKGKEPVKKDMSEDSTMPEQVKVQTLQALGKTSEIDHSTSRPTIRGGAVGTQRHPETPIRETTPARAASPALEPELGGFKSARNLKRSVDVNLPSDKRQKQDT